MQIDNQTKDQEWVILEAMGHNRVAGLYFFENGLHRVDVPDPTQPDRFIRTERYGQSAIFRITSVDEATARLVAQQCIIPEAIPWEARRELSKLAGPGERVEALTAGENEDVVHGERGYDDDWEGDDDFGIAPDPRPVVFE